MSIHIFDRHPPNRPPVDRQWTIMAGAQTLPIPNMERLNQRALLEGAVMRGSLR